MEDAHIAYQDEAKDLYIFGVFDGHGGFSYKSLISYIYFI